MSKCEKISLKKLAYSGTFDSWSDAKLQSAAIYVCLEYQHATVERERLSGKLVSAVKGYSTALVQSEKDFYSNQEQFIWDQLQEYEFVVHAFKRCVLLLPEKQASVIRQLYEEGNGWDDIYLDGKRLVFSNVHYHRQKAVELMVPVIRDYLTELHTEAQKNSGRIPWKLDEYEDIDTSDSSDGSVSRLTAFNEALDDLPF